MSTLFMAMIMGHLLGDYAIQTDRQACAKSQRSWTGRLACAAHVTTYTATVATTIMITACGVTIRMHPGMLGIGLTLNAITHYAADRREPFRWFCVHILRKRSPWLEQGGMATLDQVWHLTWLYVAALLAT